MSEKKLKKQLSLYDVFAICTGAMFSSGFFLLPGIAAAQTGESVYLAYLASGILIMPAMLSVAELSTAMPKSGGTYYFLDRSLGPMVGTIGGLGSWIALMFKSSFALIGMGAYLALFLDVSFTLLALILTLIFGFLNIFGAKETTLLQRILVTVLVLIMAIFIIQGVSAVGLDDTLQESENAFFSNGLHGFISTIGLVFVSYAGLTKVTSVAEEVENPDRNIPLGMVLSLATASFIYVAGVYVMQQVLAPGEFYTSLTPVADAGAKFMDWLPGSGGMLLIVVAAVAAFASTGNAGIMSASRYPFAMSKDKLVSPKFSDIGKQGTPYYAIIVTVISMIIILLVFDVEAVAKLASAFQLLLFGLMCFAVIVMRESNIKGYQPGFKSPLYPWVQIAGMLISVWLVAEMGILAVSLTGFILVMCVAWYIYYTKGQIRRRGAIFHVHERLGKRRYDDLELELLNILNEKNSDKHLSYKETIARSIIIDVDGSARTVDDLLDEASEILAGRLGVEKKKLFSELRESYSTRFNKLGHGAVCSYYAIGQIAAPEMVVFRIQRSLDLDIAGIEGDVYLYTILLVPEDEEGLDIRLVGHLAEVVQSSGFQNRWLQATNKRELRECLLTEGHFIHLKVKDNEQLMLFAGKKIKDISLPGSSLITIIYRGRDLIIPHGNTTISEEDEFLMVGDPKDIKEFIMKSKIRSINPITPIQEFLKTESSSGIILLVTTVLALIIANTPYAGAYFDFFQTHLRVGVSSFEINKPLILWINDGLMAVFFLLIGLEIKREVKYGELSDLKSALVPVIAAFGGALVPGLIFFGFNQGTEFADGWAIAIATDIAFAIGILTLLGSKVPVWAKVFLTAVAVVDDLIAVMVIALFYTASIEMTALIIAGIALIVLVIMNVMNMNKVGLYLLVGLVLWVAFLKSGVHATIAGVLLGLTIPARRSSGLDVISEKIEAASRLFKHAIMHKETESRETALNYVGEVIEEAESPLYRLEHQLHPWVAFGVIPIFAFANAGITINTSVLTEAFASTLTWGIVLGLFLGKQVGIFSSVYLMRKLGFSTFPEKKGTMKIVYGLACLSGVGFTMSLFIGGLSFDIPEYLEFAKVGIIVGSLLSGVLGFLMIKNAVKDYE